MGPESIVVHHVAVPALGLGLYLPAAFLQQGHKLPVVLPLHGVCRGQGRGDLVRQQQYALHLPVPTKGLAVIRRQQDAPGHGTQQKRVCHRLDRQTVQGERGGEQTAEQQESQQHAPALPQIASHHGRHPTM